jgi:hypothetical protein
LLVTQVRCILDTKAKLKHMTQVLQALYTKHKSKTNTRHKSKAQARDAGATKSKTVKSKTAKSKEKKAKLKHVT